MTRGRFPDDANFQQRCCQNLKHLASNEVSRRRICINYCCVSYCLWYIQLFFRNSSVGIATFYGLDGPRNESRWSAVCSAPIHTDPVAYRAPCTMDSGSLSRGLKRLGSGVNHPPSSNAEVQQRIDLYFYSSSGPSRPFAGRILPLQLTHNTHYWNVVWSSGGLLLFRR